MNDDLKVSENGLNLIKEFEELRLEAYQDIVGVWTIGYGHTQNVTPGMVISENEADRLLEEDVESHIQPIYNLIKVPLNQNQFDALASFLFNLGSAILDDSRLLTLINDKNFREAAEEMKLYNKAGGEYSEGLANRRELEAELFLKEDSNSNENSTYGLVIKKQLVDATESNSYGNVNSKKGITIHQTGNPNPGADAQNHANQQTSGEPATSREASWHWQVDDTEAIQSFAHEVACWHAGDGNMSTIAIEGCVNSDGDYLNAIKNLAKLTRYIMDTENISLDNVVQHNYWTGKNCPQQIRESKNGVSWNDFLDMVMNLQDLEDTPPSEDNSESSNNTGIEKKYSETGTFTPNNTIIVRDKPSTEGNRVTTYYPGEEVHYHTVYVGNGYVWLEYTSYSGEKRYVPCRTYKNGTYGELWGTIDEQNGSLESYPETGTFIPNDAIIVRDKPSTKGNRVATYYPGEEVHYHTVYVGNGYVWLEYTSYSGERRYVPCRTYENGIYGALWGSLS